MKTSKPMCGWTDLLKKEHQKKEPRLANLPRKPLVAREYARKELRPVSNGVPPEYEDFN